MQPYFCQSLLNVNYVVSKSILCYLGHGDEKRKCNFFQEAPPT